MKCPKCHVNIVGNPYQCPGCKTVLRAPESMEEWFLRKFDNNVDEAQGFLDGLMSFLREDDDEIVESLKE